MLTHSEVAGGSLPGTSGLCTHHLGLLRGVAAGFQGGKHYEREPGSVKVLESESRWGCQGLGREGRGARVSRGSQLPFCGLTSSGDGLHDGVNVLYFTLTKCTLERGQKGKFYMFIFLEREDTREAASFLWPSLTKPTAPPPPSSAGQRSHRCAQIQGCGDGLPLPMRRGRFWKKNVRNGRQCCGVCANTGCHTRRALSSHKSLFPPGWFLLCSCSRERHR